MRRRRLAGARTRPFGIMPNISKYVLRLNKQPLLTTVGKAFSPVVKAVVALPKDIKQYALFAGPRLNTVIASGSIALVGDASHRELLIRIY